MNLKWRFFQFWIAFTVIWVGTMAWFQWDNLTRKPWTLDWTFAFGQFGPPKTQFFAAEIVVLPPLALLVLGFVGLWIARGLRR